MPITIKDIARATQVSHSTVSRALTGSPLIAPATAERIRQAAQELGYLPSAAARTLKTNRSHVLGVIIRNVDDPFYSEILQGIEEVAQANDYSLFMAASHGDPTNEHLIIGTMRAHAVDGVIISSTPFSSEQSQQLCSFGIPIIVINNQSTEEYRYSISHDDLDGGQQITRHLTALGHRRIAYVGYPLAGRANLKRLQGYREEMRAAGLAAPAETILETPYSDPASGEAALRTLLALRPRPTAVFCFNDMLAIGLLHGAAAAGLRVPDDLAIAGFDNITFSHYTNPPLTTFDQPKRSIGGQAASLAIQLLSGEQFVTGTRLLKGSLLVRASTAGKEQ